MSRKCSPETELRQVKRELKHAQAMVTRQGLLIDNQNKKFKLAIQMSHVCFNIGEGKEITPRDREVCAQLQKEWDKS